MIEHSQKLFLTLSGLFAPMFCPINTPVVEAKEPPNAEGMASMVPAALLPAIAAGPKELIAVCI